MIILMGSEIMRDQSQFMEVASRVMSDESPLVTHIQIKEMWLIVSALQLATRHPGISPYMKDALTQIARQFQGAIVEIYPEANELLEMGWTPQFDV
jgi:hypothetical protein